MLFGVFILVPGSGEDTGSGMGFVEHGSFRGYKMAYSWSIVRHVHFHTLKYLQCLKPTPKNAFIPPHTLSLPWPPPPQYIGDALKNKKKPD